MFVCVFFFQAEDGIRDLVRSRGLGDVYKRQPVGATEFYWSVNNNAININKNKFDYAFTQEGEYLSLIHI